MTNPARPSRAAGWPERGISLLNGFVGDYLERRGLGLAIPLTMVQDGRPLALNESALRAAQPALTDRVVVLVHGWCCNEDVWRFADGSTYGTRLQRDAGYTPFAVRYNTGVAVGTSATALALVLRRLLAAYPAPVEELLLIGHSMGGLLIDAALGIATAEDAAWTRAVRRVIAIGTPHDSAHIARFSNGASRALAGTRTPLARQCSGNGDRMGVESDGAVAATPASTTSIPRFLIAGTLTVDPTHPVSKALGDGLVRVPAASGDVIVIPGLHHLQLAHDQAVYAVITRICNEAKGPGSN